MQLGLTTRRARAACMLARSRPGAEAAACFVCSRTGQGRLTCPPLCTRYPPQLAAAPPCPTPTSNCRLFSGRTPWGIGRRSTNVSCTGRGRGKAWASAASALGALCWRGAAGSLKGRLVPCACLPAARGGAAAPHGHVVQRIMVRLGVCPCMHRGCAMRSVSMPRTHRELPFTGGPEEVRLPQQPLRKWRAVERRVSNAHRQRPLAQASVQLPGRGVGCGRDGGWLACRRAPSFAAWLHLQVRHLGSLQASALPAV